MADTNWQDFPDGTPLAADIFLAMRGAGGINYTAAQLAAFIAANAGDGTVGAPGWSFAADPDTGIWRPTANTMAFVAGGVERARLDGSALRLQLPTTNGEYILSFDCGPLGLNTRDSQIRGGNNGANQTYLDFYTSNAAAPAHAMRIAANGSVSIGTNNPLWKHHILGSASDLAGIISTSTSSGLLIGDSTAAIRLGTRSGAFIVDVGSERLRVQTNGYVGIGASSVGNAAAAPLDVTTAAGRVFLTAFGSMNQLSSVNAANASVLGLAFQASQLQSTADNYADLGTAAIRWKVIYAVTGTINTSDERAKQDITPIPDEWLDAWAAVEWKRYKFIDAVQAKGDDARWHLGLVAQAVRDAFAASDLDARAIGLLCYDEWEEEREAIMEERQIDTETVIVDQIGTGVLDANGVEIMRDITEDRPIMGMVDTGETRVTLEAGNRWGLRYDECQAIEAAWQRRELARERAKREELEAKLAALVPGWTAD